MGNSYIKKIVLNGLMIALVFLATYFTHIPSPLPGGYFNLGDTVIIVAAIVFGRRNGLIAGAVGSFLADIAYGAFIFAPITLIEKGLEGFVAGTIASPGGDMSPGGLRRIAASVAGAAVMVAGYFAAEAFILGFFNKEFGITAAVLELPVNLMQGGISAVVGYILSVLLLKVNVKVPVK